MTIDGDALVDSRSRRVEILREPPIDDHGLAELADQHVARLEIAMDDALAVRVRHRVGDREHARQQREPVLERLRVAIDVVERAPGDELHGVERLAGRPLARLVHAGRSRDAAAAR